MAEIYFDAELLFDFLMADEKNIVVPRHGFHFRKSFFHSLDPVFERSNGNGEYFLQKQVSDLAVSVNQKQTFSIFSRSDEVAFHIPDSLFRVDILWSFVDDAFVFDLCVLLFLSTSFSCKFLSVCFDLSSMRAGDVCAYGHSGYLG